MSVASVIRALRVRLPRTISFRGKSTGAGVNVFDRQTKYLQRCRAAAAPDADNYDYVKVCHEFLFRSSFSSFRQVFRNKQVSTWTMD